MCFSITKVGLMEKYESKTALIALTLYLIDGH